jgi:hypothetical protein
MASSPSGPVIACCIIGSLAFSGCDNPADDVSIAPQAPARAVAAPADGSSAKAETGTVKGDAAHKPDSEPALQAPLDLSMPAQPAAEFGSLEAAQRSPKRLLPDLFETGEGSGRTPVRLKGRLFVPQAEEEDGDVVEGGQVTIELKTR